MTISNFVSFQIAQVGIHFDKCSKGHILDICKGNELHQIFGADDISQDDEYDLKAGPCIAYSSQGMNKTMGQTEIEWSFKCLSEGYNDMIGIMSNLDEIKELHYIFSSAYDYYMWWSFSGVYDQDDRNQNIKQTGWDTGDTIGMRLNVDDWTLVFTKNGKDEFDAIKIKNVDDESVFYPVIFIPDGPGKYTYIV